MLALLLTTLVFKKGNLDGICIRWTLDLPQKGPVIL